MEATMQSSEATYAGIGRSNERDVDPHAVLTAVTDPGCRKILEATEDEALIAAEIVERCDLPSSTTYRKLEVLTDAGLLEERLRIRRDGKHTAEYRHGFDDVTVTVTEAGEVDIVVARSGN